MKIQVTNRRFSKLYGNLSFGWSIFFSLMIFYCFFSPNKVFSQEGIAKYYQHKEGEEPLGKLCERIDSRIEQGDNRKVVKLYNVLITKAKGIGDYDLVVEAYYQRGLAFLEAEDTIRAMESLDSACELSLKIPVGENRMAKYLVGRGDLINKDSLVLGTDYERACTLCNQADNKDFFCREAYGRLSGFYGETENYHKSIYWGEMAVSDLDEDTPHIVDFKNLNRVLDSYISLRHIEKIVSVKKRMEILYQNIGRRNRDEISYEYARGLLRYSAFVGRREGAIDLSYLDRALGIIPHREEYYETERDLMYWRIYFKNLQGKEEEALNEISSCLEDNGYIPKKIKDYGFLWMKKGEILEKLDRIEEAFKVYYDSYNYFIGKGDDAKSKNFAMKLSCLYSKYHTTHVNDWKTNEWIDYVMYWNGEIQFAWATTECIESTYVDLYGEQKLMEYYDSIMKNGHGLVTNDTVYRILHFWQEKSRLLKFTEREYQKEAFLDSMGYYIHLIEKDLVSKNTYYHFEHRINDAIVIDDSAPVNYGSYKMDDIVSSKILEPFSKVDNIMDGSDYTLYTAGLHYYNSKDNFIKSTEFFLFLLDILIIKDRADEGYNHVKWYFNKYSNVIMGNHLFFHDNLWERFNERLLALNELKQITNKTSKLEAIEWMMMIANQNAAHESVVSLYEKMIESEYTTKEIKDNCLFIHELIFASYVQLKDHKNGVEWGEGAFGYCSEGDSPEIMKALEIFSSIYSLSQDFDDVGDEVLNQYLDQLLSLDWNEIEKDALEDEALGKFLELMELGIFGLLIEMERYNEAHEHFFGKKSFFDYLIRLCITYNSEEKIFSDNPIVNEAINSFFENDFDIEIKLLFEDMGDFLNRNNNSESAKFYYKKALEVSAASKKDNKSIGLKKFW